MVFIHLLISDPHALYFQPYCTGLVDTILNIIITIGTVSFSQAQRKNFQYFTNKYDICDRILEMPFIRLGKFPFIPSLLNYF